jgi:hypothetical protein
MAKLGEEEEISGDVGSPDGIEIAAARPGQLALMAAEWSAPSFAARAVRPVSVTTLAKTRFGMPTTYPNSRSLRSA